MESRLASPRRRDPRAPPVAASTYFGPRRVPGGVPRDAPPRRRDPVPPAPSAPGGYLTLRQPSLFWRAWEVEQDGVRLLRVERARRGRFRISSAAGDEDAQFVRGGLLCGALAAQPEEGGARVAGLRLLYRSKDAPYPLVADAAGPVLVFGDLRGWGLSGEGKVWAADRLLARGDDALRILAMSLLVLRERPGSFR